MQTTLSRHDYEDFLIQAYFGDYCCDSPLSACVDRSYRDFSRTLHGIRDVPDRDKLYCETSRWLAEKISAVPNQNEIQTSFDKWHSTVCVSLKDKYRDAGLDFYIGQSQKWVNMTFKYIFTLGESRLPGFSPIYQLCHVPIDRRVIQRLTPYGFPPFSKPWSRIDDYDEYIKRQQWIRNRFEMAPLDVEFRAWQKSDFNLCSAMHQPPPIR